MGRIWPKANFKVGWFGFSFYFFKSSCRTKSTEPYLSIHIVWRRTDGFVPFPSSLVKVKSKNKLVGDLNARHWLHFLLGNPHLKSNNCHVVWFTYTWPKEGTNDYLLFFILLSEQIKYKKILGKIHLQVLLYNRWSKIICLRP